MRPHTLPIQGIAKLDTCVTVVDASQIAQYFETAQSVGQRFGKQDDEEEDDRSIADLLVDQIEFADVILLNKKDLASPDSMAKAKGIVAKLNPRAKVILTRKSKVELDEILNTGLFSLENAERNAGWMLSLREEINPETEEYGISSFVYRSRRPFHPKRLFELIADKFFICETTIGDEEEEDDHHHGPESEKEQLLESGNITLEENQKRLSCKNDSPFRGVIRSKGFLWLATKPMNMGEWSSAGT
jgi:G3E family GTPase